MITLEQLNLTEEELDMTLNGIFESTDDPDKENYKRFIKEDATLNQKLALFEQNKSKFYKMIENMGYNCRQAVGGKTFERQMGVVECGTLEAARMLGAANLFQEADEKFMDEWFQKLEKNTTKLEHYLSKADGQIVTEGGWKTLFGWFLIGPIYWAAYRGIRALVDEKSKRCGVLSIGRQRDVCLWKVKAEQQRKMAALIQKNMGNCKNSKNPDKCTAVGKKKIAEYNAKAQKWLDKIKTYSDKAPAKKAKADIGLQRAAKGADTARV